MKSLFLSLLVATVSLAHFPAAYAAGQTSSVKEWTLLVFLNGDNNLDSYGTADMKEMEQIGSTSDMNIVVLRDTSNVQVSSKIYYVERGRSTPVKDYGTNIDMGDWRNLVGFFEYVQQNYPARHYVVDVWNHGAGWVREGQDPILKGISYDDNSGNHITTPQLAEAFAAMKALNGGKNIDIFGMDACLMEMAEVIYEVADSVDIVLGSEQTEPADGWEYQGFLAPLAAKPTMSPAELANEIERSYVASYNGGSQGNKPAQGSAVWTGRLRLALDKLNAFAVAASNNPAVKAKLVEAVDSTQSFYSSDYKDLLHFLKLAKSKIADNGIVSLAQEAIDALSDSVIANYITGTGLGNSNGMSIWIPTKEGYTAKRSAYSALRWTRDTQWDEFLEMLLFPTTPMVSVSGARFADENSDGFVHVGERISFQVDLFNDSPIAARDVKVLLSVPNGVTTYTQSVDVGVVAEGAKVISGLSAVIGAGMKPGVYPFKFTVVMPGLGSIEKELNVMVDPQYVIGSYNLSTPHDYANNFDKTWTVSKPGSVAIKLHFSKFATEKRYDTVSIMDKNGNVVATYDGSVEPFWTVAVPGDTVKIRLKTDSSVTAYGFDIDKIAY